MKMEVVNVTTERNERQKLAAQIRAARATRTFRSYFKDTGWLNADAWYIATMKSVELAEKCCAHGCDQNAVRRIAVNIWGTVTEADVCLDHADRHGMWIDRL